MNGIKSLTFKALLPLLLILTTSIDAVEIWPDRVEPSVKLDEAIEIAKAKLSKVEVDDTYCLNATLINGENSDTSIGYWTLGLTTELGNNYSVSVRMDRRISVKKIKKFKTNTPNPWPDTITPPIRIEEALEQATSILKKKKKQSHYCLNATLVTGSNDVYNDGMWNFLFQATTPDPQLINIRMNGKSAIKEVGKLKAYSK